MTQRFLVGVLLVVLQFACIGMAYAQPIDVRIERDLAVEDYDFSWVYWFETRGQGYVQEAMESTKGGQGEFRGWDTPASRRWRGQVIEGLRPRLADEDASVRAAAVLALARMGDEGVLGWLLPGPGGRESLLLDRSAEVRLSAWVSLGLIATDEARVALGARPFESADEVDRVGQAVGIGLLRTLDRVHAQWLLDRLADQGESLEVKRWCLWAMARHDDGSVDEVFWTALVQQPSPFVIGEVLGSAGYVQRRGGARWLVDVLRYHPAVRDWQGYRVLAGLPEAGGHGSTPRRLAMETRVAAALALMDQPWIEDDEDRRWVLLQLRRRMVAGNSTQAMDFNRGFDTLAYFMHCAGDQSDRDLLYDQLRGVVMLRPDDPGVLAALEEGEEPSEADLVVRQLDNEVRGYAALAAGLLIRRATEGTALYEQRPVVVGRAIEVERLKRRFGRRLMRAVTDRREPVSYRAACALALGLTEDERYRAELSVELGKLQRGDEAVLGYGLLALAMLGDERVVDPAARYLTRPGQVEGIGDYLGRRAALRAIGIVGEAGDVQAAGDALAKGWGRNPWVSLDVAEATAWVGRYDAVPGMLTALESESAVWRAAAARSLGAAFEADWPSRLSGLLEGFNPTLSLRLAGADLQADEQVVRPESEQQKTLPWPRGSVYRLSDPFYIAMRQGFFNPRPAVRPEAPPDPPLEVAP